MSLHNTSQSYGRVARALHWTTAALILILLPLGFVAENAAQSINAPGATPGEFDLERIKLLFSLHKTLGVGVFATALVRLIWMVLQPRPAPLHPERRLETWAAETVHFALYLSLVATPLSGWIHHAATTGYAPIWGIGQSLPFVPQDPQWAKVASILHGISVWILLGTLALHVAGALKHHLIDRDSTLPRMTKGIAAGTPATRHATLLPLLCAVAIWGAVPLAANAVGVFKTDLPTAPALAQVASDWQVNEGHLSLAIRQMGNRVEGRFTDWTAQISFADDPAQQKNGAVRVTVSIPSLVLGTLAQQAMGPDYFDATQHPTAQFEADILRQDDGFVAIGTLTIRDHALPLTLPFALTPEGDGLHAVGTVTVDRRAYSVGTGMTDEGTLGFTVEIGFDLIATRS